MKKALFFVVFGFFSLMGVVRADVADWAEYQYNNLGSTELQLQRSVDNHPLLGMGVSQKDFPNGFCRKYSPIVPNPTARYACFREFSSGTGAEQTYEAMNVDAVNVGFYSQGEPLVGVAYAEKQVEQNSIALICSESYPIVPHPIMSYACYQEMMPIGGGISVGN